VLALSPAAAGAQGPTITVFFGDPGGGGARSSVPVLGVTRAAVVSVPNEPLPEPAPEPPSPAEPPPAAALRGEPPCPGVVTVVRRMGGHREEMRTPLLDCDGNVSSQARAALSVIARPRQREDAPTDEEIRAWRDADHAAGRAAEDAADHGASFEPDRLAEDVALLHPGLLERVQRIADAFPGHPIEILSGYRPRSPSSSRHHHARALDLSVTGVAREQVRDFAVTLPQTGVGWYPNSVFVHVDVREREAYWVDLSGPGERPRYVAGSQSPLSSEAPADPAEAAAGASTGGRPDESIEAALRTVRRGLRVTLPGEEPPELGEALEPPEDVPPPTDAELEQMRRETDAILRQIRVAPL
jgi:uncharacterized protein YcbK (DUF882 family)